METDKQTFDETEHRSEKVSLLLSEIPLSLVRWGTLILAIVLVALVATVCLLPYPYSNGESIILHLLFN